eukprot:6151660-Pleurochrysis_carterae.AAC.1
MFTLTCRMKGTYAAARHIHSLHSALWRLLRRVGTVQPCMVRRAGLPPVRAPTLARSVGRAVACTDAPVQSTANGLAPRTPIV